MQIYYNNVFKENRGKHIPFSHKKTEQCNDHLYFFFIVNILHIFLIEFYLIDPNIHFYGLYTL